MILEMLSSPSRFAVDLDLTSLSSLFLSLSLSLSSPATLTGALGWQVTTCLELPESEEEFGPRIKCLMKRMSQASGTGTRA